MNLTINSKFRPFTYDEMVKPLVQYKEVYDKLEQDYSDLAAQTEILKDIAERTGDTSTYNKYNTYYNDLNAAIDDFSKGMNMSNRSALLKLQRRYHSDIEPISKASKRIEELSDEQRKLAAANPDIMFDRDFSTDVTVDQMINNPNLSYKTINGDAIYKKGAEISKAIASRMHSMQLDPELKGQYWKIREGFSEEEANKFLLDSGAFPELNQALNDLVESTGAPDNLKDRVYNYAKQGAISGMVGKTSYKDNQDYETAAQRHSRRLQEYQLALSAANAGMEWDKDKKKWVYNPDNHPAIQKLREQAALNNSNPNNWVQEVVNGVATGRYYDPQTKKYFNQDGTLAQQGVYKQDAPDSSIYRPLFFDATSGSASKGFQLKGEINDQDSGWLPWKDTRSISYSDIKGSDAKKAIKDYIYNITGIPGTVDIPDGAVEAIANILQITRDRDWFSDNHFAVRIPGTDDEGNIISKPDFENAMLSILSQLKSNPVISNSLPNENQ